MLVQTATRPPRLWPAQTPTHITEAKVVTMGAVQGQTVPDRDQGNITDLGNPLSSPTHPDSMPGRLPMEVGRQRPVKVGILQPLASEVEGTPEVPFQAQEDLRETMMH